MRDWFDTPLGRFVLREEQLRVAELLPAIYYPNALQIGQPAVDFLRGVEAGQRCLVVDRDHAGAATTDDGDKAGAGHPPPHRIIARPEALPFAAKAHNLITMPHALERCADPRAALREAAQILAPQGCVAITGFNPLSLWGAWRPFMRLAGRRVWGGAPLRAGYVQDELRALGFELAGAAFLLYRPPSQNAERQRDLSWLEDAGARWWPGLGAVYVIIARKSTVALSRPATARTSRWRWTPGLAQPATRAALPRIAGAARIAGATDQHQPQSG